MILWSNIKDLVIKLVISRKNNHCNHASFAFGKIVIWSTTQNCMFLSFVEQSSFNILSNIELHMSEIYFSLIWILASKKSLNILWNHLGNFGHL
jgi:hypothetical protein